MDVDNPLDRAVWNALTTRQAARAQGGPRALRMDADYGFFAAAADPSANSMNALLALGAPGMEMGVVELEPPPAIPGLGVVTQSPIWQMIHDGRRPAGAPGLEIVPLTEADAPEMLALATLTRPGPFYGRTHQLGDFFGIRIDGRLAAMAGERLKVPGHTEVSGVCAHPDFRGRGYAATLMGVVIARILARGETAFLHAFPTNSGAIALHESLGFSLRREFVLTVLAPT
ncbi:MAG: GNAT family N-acetyltransferase [Phenylobacterium sp.]|nr:GNAT family N-acetyltransferase [Phenylobacterium sp.]